MAYVEKTEEKRLANIFEANSFRYKLSETKAKNLANVRERGDPNGAFKAFEELIVENADFGKYQDRLKCDVQRMQKKHTSTLIEKESSVLWYEDFTDITKAVDEYIMEIVSERKSQEEPAEVEQVEEISEELSLEPCDKEENIEG